MAYHQKIQCTVTECAHNSIEDATCRLDKILVSHGKNRNDKNSEDETACAMYLFSGNLNAESYSRNREN